MQLVRDSPVAGKRTPGGPSKRRAGVLTSVLWLPRESKHRTCTGGARGGPLRRCLLPSDWLRKSRFGFGASVASVCCPVTLMRYHQLLAIRLLAFR